MRKPHRLGAVVLLGLLLAGCGSSGLKNIAPDQRLAYKRQQEAAENLEIPPDLTAGNFDDALDIPAPGGAATYSEFEGQRSRRQAMTATVGGAVLPEVDGVEVRREGGNRWLVAEATPQRVWPQIVAFWREQGILLVEQDPATGTMRTDWLENRAEIRRDFITKTLRKVVDGLYATSTRDQYRVRIEPGLASGTTEIYLTHRGMEERLVRNTVGEGSNTVWEPAGSDPDKEAEMLRRLMIYLGVSEQGAERMIAQGTQEPSISRLATGGGAPELVIAEEFRRAWRVTGLALDRIGFAVEDQDYSRGVFFVRYAAAEETSEEKGLLSKLAFWRSNDGSSVAKYQVKLEGSGEQTRVTVLDAAGRRENSETAERILRLLQEEIR